MKLRLALLCIATFLAGNSVAQTSELSKLSDNQRLERLERLTSSEVLSGQAQIIDSLREEITLLREQIEQQGYELDTLKQRQRSLYVDMDRRISGVESGTGTSRVRTTSPVPPPSTGIRKHDTLAPVAVAGDKDGKEHYQKAFSLIKDGHYQQSITAFVSFLKNYPQSRYADNAQYWLGEAHSADGKYKKALQEFQRLISQYPESTKNPGARLKIGYVYYELNNWSASKEALQQVVKLYPDATVAKKANERLKRIKREGH